MAFNLDAVLKQAENVVAESENNGGGGNKARIVYPSDGTINLRILFNPASGQALRQIRRHTVGDTKVPCLETYGQDCPVCKTLEEINKMKGTDLWEYGGKFRGLAFAEYINSDYQWSQEYPAPKEGEIILFMFPWTVYKDIQLCINQAGENAKSLLATPSGRFFKITRSRSQGQVKYSTSIDAFATRTTRATEEEFDALLNGMDDLNTQIMPNVISDDIISSNKELAINLRQQYLGAAMVSSATSGVQQDQAGQSTNTLVAQNGNGTQVGGQQSAQVNQGTSEQSGNGSLGVSQQSTPDKTPTNFGDTTQSTQPASEIPAEYQACYGKGCDDATKCMLCPLELKCKEARG